MEGLNRISDAIKEIGFSIQSAKNLLVDGKVILADRKLQACLTYCNKILQNLSMEDKPNDPEELADSCRNENNS